MSRIGLAFRCFFRLLFSGQLPEQAAEYLPPGAQPHRPALPEAPTVPAPRVERVEPKPAAAPAPRAAPTAKPESQREGALALLALLQREGRLVDFLQESIDSYDDADIGAAVRDIHRGCKKVLADHLVLEPVMPGAEDDQVSVPRGFDPGEIRLVGEVSGEPPFKGVLRHHGWRVVESKLPTLSEGVDRNVVAPAEVEVG